MLPRVALLLPCLVAALGRADAGAGPTTATAPGAATQPGLAAPATQPAETQPAASAPAAENRWAALTKFPPEVPALSGELFHVPYSFHGQATAIPEFHGKFPSAYEGANSFRDQQEYDTSYTGTLFFGARVRPGTEVYVDPEVLAGNSLSGVNGLGDPPNGETTPVAGAQPSPNIARLFVRQTFGFGGEQEDIPDGQNQIAGRQDINRLTLTAGKFAANDIFDNNTYAHDPRSQFFNGAFMDNTAWDYPTDAKGYTDGITLELNRKSYTLRYGIFREPQVAGGEQLDPHWDKAIAQAVELEYRYRIFGQPGAVRPMAFLNHADMGDYAQAIAQAHGGVPDVTANRSYRYKYGYGFNAEQAITSDLGLCARAGWNDGHTETWAFTEVDREASLGLSLQGTAWGRKHDVLGVGGFISGLSQDHRDYLEAGGLGFELGDGRLRYAPEEGIETYYLIALTRNIFLSLDFQFLGHPGFNADRGPVPIGGFRVHFEF
jgi:high affinity Mn2+ porin